jgi:hypothetical protein
MGRKGRGNLIAICLQFAASLSTISGLYFQESSASDGADARTGRISESGLHQFPGYFRMACLSSEEKRWRDFVQGLPSEMQNPYLVQESRKK